MEQTTTITLDTALFRNAVKWASSAAAKDGIGLPALTGVHFTVGGTGTYDHPKHYDFRTFDMVEAETDTFNISLAATDRFRLAWASMVAQDQPLIGEPATFLIPAADLTQMLRCLPKRKRGANPDWVNMAITTESALEEGKVTAVEFITASTSTKLLPMEDSFPKYHALSGRGFEALDGPVGYNPTYLAQMAKSCAEISGKNSTMRLRPQANKPTGIACDSDPLKASAVLMPVRLAS